MPAPSVGTDNRERILRAIIEQPQTFGELEKYFKSQTRKEDRLTAPTLMKHLKDLMSKGLIKRDIIEDKIQYHSTRQLLDAEELRKRIVAAWVAEISDQITKGEDIFVSIGRRVKGNPELTERFLQFISDFYLTITSPEARRFFEKNPDARVARDILKKGVEKSVPLKGKLRDSEELISWSKDWVKAVKALIVGKVGDDE